MIFSDGFTHRGETYLVLLIAFGRVFEIKKPRWLWEYQEHRDGRYFTNPYL